MLDNKGFNLWADGYDKAVGLSDQESCYPFAGYKNILASIYQIVMKKTNAVVLEIGFGIATLTTKLYEQGCKIYGQDFSSKMIELATAKMPNARLYFGDFAQAWWRRFCNTPTTISWQPIHCIIYPTTKKILFIHLLKDVLRDGGQILIADVAFETRFDLEKCREAVGEEWDDEEVYFVADELQRDFPELKFVKFSHCAGIISLAR